MKTTTKLIRTEWAESHPLLTKYYDEEWGMPVYGEAEIFERLSLEAFQSGLSWLTVLKKRDTIRRAFLNFDIESVANFNDSDVNKLMETEGLIRNQNKIKAIIKNAQTTIDLRSAIKVKPELRNLSNLVWSFMPERSPAVSSYTDMPTSSPESEALAKELKRLGFLWVGPTSVYAAMGAIGIVDQHIVSSHKRGCSGLWNIDGTRAD
ncbi:MAG TPA: DNA-3-methyladenine glycosylase I [Microbacteriaceae bacterium]|nr:DNA-3-methyladenine glycosylase I [Microbacteriaceae bacterium]